MSEFKTIEQLARERATQQTPPLDMNLFANMLDGNPLEFEDHGHIYQIPLGMDVKMIFKGLVEVAATAADVPDGHKTQLAYKYAVGVVQQEKKQEASADGDRNKRPERPLSEH